jgi:hypothetical protein
MCKTYKVDDKRRIRLPDLRPGDYWRLCPAISGDLLVLRRLEPAETPDGSSLSLERLPGGLVALEICEAAGPRARLELTAEGLAGLQMLTESIQAGKVDAKRIALEASKKPAG